jgi:hypothetical protein
MTIYFHLVGALKMNHKISPSQTSSYNPVYSALRFPLAISPCHSLPDSPTPGTDDDGYHENHEGRVLGGSSPCRSVLPLSTSFGLRSSNSDFFFPFSSHFSSSSFNPQSHN